MIVFFILSQLYSLSVATKINECLKLGEDYTQSRENIEESLEILKKDFLANKTILKMPEWLIQKLTNKSCFLGQGMHGKAYYVEVDDKGCVLKKVTGTRNYSSLTKEALNEANIIARLSGGPRASLDVYGVFTYKNHPYILQNFVKGRLLMKVLAGKDPILGPKERQKECERWQDYCRKKGVFTSEDFSFPTNVIVSKDNQMNFLDYGLYSLMDNYSPREVIIRLLEEYKNNIKNKILEEVILNHWNLVIYNEGSILELMSDYTRQMNNDEIVDLLKHLVKIIDDLNIIGSKCFINFLKINNYLSASEIYNLYCLFFPDKQIQRVYQIGFSLSFPMLEELSNWCLEKISQIEVGLDSSVEEKLSNSHERLKKIMNEKMFVLLKRTQTAFETGYLASA